MRLMLLRFLKMLSLLIRCLLVTAVEKAAPFELREGDRVVFLGDTLMEREQQFGWIELMLTTQFLNRNAIFHRQVLLNDSIAG